MRRALRLATFALCSLAGAVASADVVFDGSLGEPGPAPAGVVGSTAVDYRIGPERGALRGSNLFFSFERFSIEAGKIGAFDGPAGIENVLARVTGRLPSHIDGLLGSAIPGADLWLLNPAGVIVGPDARLVLRGGFHVSTADYLRLADGTRFSASSGDASGLSVAPPEAFGFLSSSPAGIEFDVTGNDLRVGRGNRLALVAGDVSIHAGGGDSVGFLWAQDARIDLAAVRPAGTEPLEVQLRSGDSDTLALSGAWLGGSIAIREGAVLSSSGFSPANPFDTFSSPTDGAGDIRILGGSLLVSDGEIHSETGGNEPGGNIDVALTGDFEVRTSGDLPSGLFAGTGIRRGFLSAFGIGPGGRISVRSENVALTGRAVLSTSSISLGDAGDISIDARDAIRMSGAGGGLVGAGIFSSSTLSGLGGDIRIAARDLSMDAGAGIVTETRFASSGGNIAVDVDTLSLRSGARIDSSIRSFSDVPAAGGTIDIRARREVTIAGRESEDVFSGITAIAQGATDTLPASTARAGDITIQTPRLGLADGGTISTQALGSGDGGSITVWTGQLEMNGGIVSASAVEGQGGDVSIHANQRVLLRGGSVITAKASGAGNAGRIDVDAGRELALDRSEITTESALSDGGEVNVRARELVRLSKSEISTSVGGGTGGSITIDPDHVVLNQSQIVARAGAGTGGSIRIVAGQFVADVDSAVDASSQTGIDGTVQIVSPDVNLTGTLDVLPSNFSDASGLLRQACAAARREGGGSFVVATSPRAPAPPDAPLGAGTRDDAAASCR